MKGAYQNHVVRLESHRDGGRTIVPSVIIRPRAIHAVSSISERVAISAGRRAVGPTPPHFKKPKFISFRSSSFSGMVGKFAVLLIVPVLVFRPLVPLYAADENVAPATQEAAPAEVVTPAEVAPQSEIITENVVTEDVVVEEGIAEETVADTVPPLEDVTENRDMPTELAEEISPELEPVVEIEATTTDVIIPAENDASATSSNEILDIPADVSGTEVYATTTESIATSTEEVLPEDVAITEDLASTTTDEALDEEEMLLEEEASTTDDVIQEVIPALNIEEIISQAVEGRTRDMERRLKQDLESELLKGCITLDGVGYYCLKEDTRMNGKTTQEVPLSALRSAVIAEGTDKEIVAERGGETIRLTDNDVEDAF